MDETMEARCTALLLLVPLWGLACGRRVAPPPEDLSPSPPSSPTATADAAEPGLTPLRSDPAILPLTVEGFPDAVISMPLGAASPRPVVVATHGMWDFPEGLC